MESHNLKDMFVVLSPDKQATRVVRDPGLYERLDREFNQFKGHELIALHEFQQDWPSWEIHPKGDEIVVLIAGTAIFVLEQENGTQQIELTQPGDYVVVPRNTWHTAHIAQYASLLFITPGEDTGNRSLTAPG